MTRKMIIFLIRHGEIDNPKKVFYGRTIDLSLNDEGKRQLTDVSERIKNAGFNIDKIYTSPLKRARQSTYIVAKTFGLGEENIVVESDLADVDIPALVGKPLTLRNEIHNTGTDEYDTEWEKKGNEARQHVVDRMKAVFERAIQENPEKTVALVSHGDPLALLMDALEHPEREVLTINILKYKDLPQKGQAVKIVLDKNGKFVSKEFI